MTDTPASLDALEDLLAKATPGEWGARGWGDGSTEMGMTNVFNDDAAVLLMECIPEADAAAIVALHNAAPDLIAKARRVDALDATIERQAGLIERLRSVLKTYADDYCESPNGAWCGHLRPEECAGCEARAAIKENTDATSD